MSSLYDLKLFPSNSMNCYDRTMNSPPANNKRALSPQGVQWLNVDADHEGQRIDNYLMARLKGAPRSLIYRILRKGEVRVNKGRVKPEYRLHVGDRVRIPPLRLGAQALAFSPSDRLQQQLQASILYEDADLLIINKPSGLAVHGGSGIHLGLIECLRQMRPDSSLGLVHRLDRETSGCIMVAKNSRCLRTLQECLREGSINKTYWALVAGRWPNRRKQVNAWLLKNQLASGERMVRVVEMGTERAKSARTEYRVLENYASSTLIEAKPITGRTHQIRVHCQYAGHTILGDEKYGGRNLSAQSRDLRLRRLFLHATKLELTDYRGRQLQVQAPLSSELQCVLNRLASSDKMNKSLQT